MTESLRSFLADLQTAFAAWRVAPLLPVFSLSVAALSQGFSDTVIWVGDKTNQNVGLLGLVELAFLVIGLFSLGSVGTERLWYRRAWQGEGHMSAGEVWSLSWQFVGRYLVLGLYCGAPLAVIFWIWLAHAFPSRRFSPFAGGYLVALYVVFALIDFALTFVTPALAYTTRRARTAIRIGWRLIARTWPASAMYVVVPPLAVLTVARANPGHLNPVVALLPVMLVTLINLLMKGATAAFYLRHVKAAGADVTVQ
jgi:hypothetical protein